MKTKQRILGILALVMIVPLAFALTACGKDKVDNTTTGATFKTLKEFNDQAKAAISARGETPPTISPVSFGGGENIVTRTASYDTTSGGVNFKLVDDYGTMIFCGKSSYTKMPNQNGGYDEFLVLFDNDTNKTVTYKKNDETWEVLQQGSNFNQMTDGAMMLYVLSTAALYNVASTTDDAIKYTPKDKLAYENAMAVMFPTISQGETTAETIRGLWDADTAFVQINKDGTLNWSVDIQASALSGFNGQTKTTCTVTLGGQTLPSIE